MLSDVLGLGQYLKVGLAMEAADELALQWVNVIDFVTDASFVREPRSLRINRADSLLVRPRHRCPELPSFTLSNDRIPLVPVGLRPHRYSLNNMLRIFFPPFPVIFASVRTILSMPAAKSAGIFRAPSISVGLDA